MSFDIEKIGSGEWFPFMDSKIGENGEVEWLPVDPECDEKVCFRQLGPDRYREIHDKYKGKKTNIPVQNPTSRGMEVVPQYEQTPAQEKAERMAFWDEQIVDWNITTPDGKPIPCTAETKYKLITGESRFLRYANKCIQLMSGTKTDEDKEKTKNLSTTSSLSMNANPA
jgi:hypothetical protein